MDALIFAIKVLNGMLQELYSELTPIFSDVHQTTYDLCWVEFLDVLSQQLESELWFMLHQDVRVLLYHFH